MWLVLRAAETAYGEPLRNPLPVSPSASFPFFFFWLLKSSLSTLYIDKDCLPLQP